MAGMNPNLGPKLDPFLEDETVREQVIADRDSVYEAEEQAEEYLAEREDAADRRALDRDAILAGRKSPLHRLFRRLVPSKARPDN